MHWIIRTYRFLFLFIFFSSCHNVENQRYFIKIVEHNTPIVREEIMVNTTRKPMSISLKKIYQSTQITNSKGVAIFDLPKNQGLLIRFNYEGKYYNGEYEKHEIIANDTILIELNKLPTNFITF